MFKIAIAGPSGFMGKHLQWYFYTQEKYQVLNLIPKSAFTEGRDTIASHICESEVVIYCIKSHSANTEKSKVYETNVTLAKELIEACKIQKNKPRIVFVSSIHAKSGGNEYGDSLKVVEELFADYAKENSTVSTNIIVPHEFGEWCKPYTISVVSTFCEELVNGKPSKVDSKGVVRLVHVQRIVHKIAEVIENAVSGDVVVEGEEISVSDLYETLKKFKEAYYSDLIPELKSDLHVELFNTLISHVFSSGKFYPRTLDLYSDERGRLFEMVKEQTGGQTFMSTTKPSITRGNHFHTRKIERFCVLEGDAEIKLKQPFTELETSFMVSGKTPQYIDMPTFVSHNITNIGKGDLVTAFWSNEILNKKDPDTYYYEV